MGIIEAVTEGRLDQKHKYPGGNRGIVFKIKSRALVVSTTATTHSRCSTAAAEAAATCRATAAAKAC